MNGIEFVTMADAGLAPEVLAMMNQLYAEDEAASVVDRGRFPMTIQTLLGEPDRGRIVLFREASVILGYALLIPLWSNEFGGTLILVDELFVKPESRGRGIGRRFLEFIRATHPFDAVAAVLEVSPHNTRAQRLYESVGFTARRNHTLTWRW